ncbi:MAG: Ig-like domain-containing protein [Terracidiphilus sp.]
MRDRSLLGALLLIGLVVPLTGCTNNSGLDAIQVSPATQSLTVGQSSQFTATGTFGNASHPSTKDVTTAVTWSSSTPSVATIDSGGIAAAVGGGTTTITATAAGFRGPVTSSATLTVTASSGGQTGGSVVSISVIPGSQSVASPSQTAQFIAIGTTSSGATENLTNAVLWSSSSTQIATIGVSTGLATGVSQGTSTITALYSNPANGTTVTGIATFTVVGGATQQYTAVAITPSSQALSASGQTGQFIALATSGSTGLQVDVTNSSQITWSSSSPSVATISGSGLASGVSVGTTTITALLKNSDNSVVTATATISVSLTSAPEPILSLTIIPSSITVADFQLSGQFLAIGTFSTPPYVRDLTNSPTTTWLSSAPNSFPVNTNSGGGSGASAGIVTAYGSGGAVIIAESASSDGTIQTATATFSCPEVLPPPAGSVSQTPGSCYPGEPLGSQLVSTLTIYNRGLNTTNWLVTAPSATGTPNVLHCGPGWTGTGGSVCTASYPTSGTVVLTSPDGAGAFGGWSSNCVPSNASGTPLPGPVYWTAAGPNYCVVSLVTDDTVGIIVN